MKLQFQRRLVAASVAVLVTGLIAACGSTNGTNAGVFDSKLVFDKTKYSTITVMLDGVSTPVRWYREVCYVSNPMKLAPTQPTLGAPISVDNQDCGYQNMNIFCSGSGRSKARQRHYVERQ